MDTERQKRLEKDGWVIGDAWDFVGLTPKPIALLDLDGTVCDYNKALRRDMDKLRGPQEPEYPLFGKHPPHIKARIDMIRRQPGWWSNLETFQLGFDVLELLRDWGFAVNVLTKGPESKSLAWKEKIDWARANLPGIPVTITENKSLVYGRILVDDYPGYVESWLEHRPRGLVIMPANEGNADFSHPNVIRYDGTNIDTVVDALKKARVREDGEVVNYT